MKNFTKKILFQINLVAALGIMLAYLANHVTPVSFWALAFFGLAYPYLLFTNLIFLIFWSWRRKKYALLSLIVILSGFNNIGRYIQIRIPQNHEQVDSTQLNVLSYNVRIFNDYNWAGENISRDSIIDFVNSQEPDIICFQEFSSVSNTKNQSEEYTNNLLNRTPYKHIRYTISKRSNRRFGVATFSKHPIIRRGSIHFDHSYNTCIYSDLIFNADTIRVYNVHLQSVSLKKNYTIVDSLAYINTKRIDEVKDISDRLKQAFIRRALQVDAVKKHIEKSPYPVLVCGDFNDTPVSYSYQQLLGDRFDSFREVGTGFGKTYIGRLPSYRIDYIFHDKNFKAISYKTPKVRLSDHYPVISTLGKVF